MAETTDRSKKTLGLAGTPASGLTMATFGFFAGLTSIVFYGAAGPTFMEVLGLTGAHTGLLLSSPHLSKALLRTLISTHRASRS